jgi:hypothetical protein
MRGLVDDFQNRTTKAAIMQFGHAAERTAAFEFQKCHLADMPIDATINNQAGVKIVLEADDDYVSGSELQSSAVRVHMF